MVAKMVARILGLSSLTGDDNAADALAIAIAAAGAAKRPY
jgi:Holliday junction resolvasome RuvABC endonuclease subunit